MMQQYEAFLKRYNTIQRGAAYRQQSGGIGFYEFPALLKLPMIAHGFTARTGGVSTGCYASLNLSFSREEEQLKTVLENYRLFAQAAGIPWESMVMDTFAHGVQVRLVDKHDSGKGYLRPSLPFCDGLFTNDTAITLVTGHADCLPLFVVDPVKRCIGLAHAGWKGTLHRIAGHLIQAMQRHFQSDAADMLAGIGPCICGDCFEVDAALGEAFCAAFANAPVTKAGRPGKAYVDLPMATAAQYMDAGIPPGNILCMDVCTFENPDTLYSHRRDAGMTGGMAAFLRLLPEPGTEAFLQMPTTCVHM